jgi:hypothetical protein
MSSIKERPAGRPDGSVAGEKTRCSCTSTESHPTDLIRIKLEFLRPFAATNTAEFTLKPDGEKTALTWSMTGTSKFMTKAFHLFLNMDKMIGGQFEKGLADIKAIAEGVSRT